MKQALIDIGSNSMRLSLYETDEAGFRILFREKIMAGLAGYAKNRVLSHDGIECACSSLLEFRETLDALGIGQVAVFATASLRNIKNTAEAVSAVKKATGYDVDVLSEKDEAVLGYIGAMQELNVTSGAFLDIGGASTELVSFEDGKILESASFPVGSLNLYKMCVKKILPGNGSLKRMRKLITEEIDRKHSYSFDKRSPLICVGGTARAVMKIARKMYALPPDCCSVSMDQLNDLCKMLYQKKRSTVDLVLKLEPDRVHTLIPGAAILQHIARMFDSYEIVVSKYGVREGYLCQRIIRDGNPDKA